MVPFGMTIKHLAPALLLIAVAGCTTPQASSPSLNGTTWRFTSIDGESPVAADASLQFGERLSAKAGCNGMSGAWRLEGDRLVAGPLASTRMFCEGKMEQENAIGALLSERPVVMLEGDQLTLSSSAHTAVLARTG